MNKDARIYVAGSTGMVGSAIHRALAAKGFDNTVLSNRKQLDLTDASATKAFFNTEKPDYVMIAAAQVGGIHANNSQPVEFLLNNLRIQNNVIEHAVTSGVKKLLFLGSSCIYPKLAEQPLTEDSLLSGPLEPTNEAYAIAKIAGVKLCQAYSKQYGANCISAMPTNLYGANDNFDLQSSHVLPALIRKFHDAKVKNSPQVEVWGSGKPLREFLHVDDLADACMFLMTEDTQHDIVNVGSGSEISINDLATTIARIVDFNGEIVFDSTMPDGTPRKLLDSSRIAAMGWRPSIDLETGIQTTYQWALQHEFGSH